MPDPATTAAPPKRRWFQFTLRTLLIVVTLLAIACANVRWQMESYTKEWHDEQAALDKIEKLSGRFLKNIEIEQVGPEWLHRIVPAADAKIFDRVAVIQIWDYRDPPIDRDDTEALIVQLKILKHLRDVSLIGNTAGWFSDPKIKHAFGDVYTGFQYTE